MVKKEKEGNGVSDLSGMDIRLGKINKQKKETKNKP